jgi:hypothetical protein
MGTNERRLDILEKRAREAVSEIAERQIAAIWNCRRAKGRELWFHLRISSAIAADDADRNQARVSAAGRVDEIWPDEVGDDVFRAQARSRLPRSQRVRSAMRHLQRSRTVLALAHLVRIKAQ